ncbi:MAG: ATP-binding cassette domain-containing protein [Sulfurimicrobium sp.]|nr:ATP-binding cassette domain-containing protein [Sulfurimicrobium sp.]MDZ7657191.1 ATP-binding cassette domain-containing protein [Sulfurimicrobium sp.]
MVAGLDLALAPGECFGLLGPNGAGKTTTLRLLLGLTRPDGGTISLLGLPVPEKAREARLKVGVVPQMDSLDPDFTVTENLLVYGRYFGLKDQDIRARIPALLEFAELEGKADAGIESLSGGMKRRLTLARALVNDPDVIFLDEPTTGLDPQARHMMWQRLRRLLGEGKTILLTTHFMEEAERLCDRLLIMDKGVAVATGAPRDLIAEHIEPHVVEIYGDHEVRARTAEYAALCDRQELVGETMFCYATDPQPLIDVLKPQCALRYLHRPANLEDLFLKLTGRELRE